jgi:hypothetical protein
MPLAIHPLEMIKIKFGISQQYRSFKSNSQNVFGPMT